MTRQADLSSRTRSLFGAPFFHNLGVGPACSLLAGLNILFIIPLFVRLSF